MLFVGLCAPLSASLLLTLLINPTEDSSVIRGGLLSVRVVGGSILYVGLIVSLFFRFVISSLELLLIHILDIS